MRIEPGLDLVDTLKPSQGWVAAEIRAKSEHPWAVVAEAGYRLNEAWSLYGDAWTQPGESRWGADLGARWNRKLDIFAGATGTYSGDWETNAGLRWKF